MNADGTGSGARWPVFIDALIRDYGRLRTDEWAVFMRIASRAGWDGNWCTESAEATAEAFEDLSARAVYDIYKVLIEANMIEAQKAKGRGKAFRPRRPEHWVDAQQLRFIREDIYAYRKRKPRVEKGNVEILSRKAKEIDARLGGEHQQLDLISLSEVFNFALDDSMHAWAEAECPQAAVHLGEHTKRFIEQMERNVNSKGYNIDRVDLREEWKEHIRRAQYRATQSLQKGNANVSGMFRGRGEGNQVPRTGANTDTVPRFGTRRG